MSCKSIKNGDKYLAIQRLEELKEDLDYVLNSPRLDPILVPLPFTDAQVAVSSVIGLNQLAGAFDIEFVKASNVRKRKRDELEEYRNLLNDQTVKWDARERELVQELADATADAELIEGGKTNIVRVSEPAAWFRFVDYDLNWDDGRAINSLNGAAAYVATDIASLFNSSGDCKGGGKACYDATVFNEIEQGLNDLSQLLTEYAALSGWKRWYGKHEDNFGVGISLLTGLSGGILGKIGDEQRAALVELILHSEKTSALIDQIIGELQNNDSCNESEDSDEENKEQCEAINANLERIAVGLENMEPCNLDPVVDAVNEASNKVGDIDKKLGEYPVSVPSNLAKNGSDSIEIQDIATQLSYNAIQMVNLIGVYPQKIINKTDPDKTTPIELPNVAESLTEVVGMNLKLMEVSEQLLRMNLSLLSEQVSTNKMLVQCRHQLNNITDFLAFKVKKKKETMPIPITFETDDIDKALEPSEIEIDYEDFDGGLDGTHYFRILNTIYAILKNTAVHDEDEIDTIIDELATDTSSLRDFLNDFERGFIDENQATEKVNPYGKRYSQRPYTRITDGSGSDATP